VVEIDPYDPSFTPKKRTALGRFKHEGAVPVVATDGRMAVYSGDDARFEYVNKFVTADRFDRYNRDANLGLLDRGTLYVAKFNDDGTGEWLALIAGVGALADWT
jgi:secreted PhoX family phosphatase